MQLFLKKGFQYEQRSQEKTFHDGSCDHQPFGVIQPVSNFPPLFCIDHNSSLFCSFINILDLAKDIYTLYRHIRTMPLFFF